MAKNFFQDIAPPDDDSPQRFGSAPAPQVSEDEGPNDVPINKRNAVPEEPLRGIRSISAPRSRPHAGPDVRETPPALRGAPPRRPRVSAPWIWGIAVASALALGALALVAFRPTTVTVVPKSHAIIFTDAMQFTAYPAAVAASGTLPYTVQASDIDIEDSQVVPGNGTTSTEASKASGSITVFNKYSVSTVHLVKNTRFETQDGLVFRVPDAVSIPGKKGSTPGQAQVTAIADAAGPEYNIAPARFTLPGLKSNPAMYAQIYAQSSAAMSGGSSGGNAPSVDAATLASAIARLRQGLSAKAQEAAAAAGGDSFAVPAQITYEDLPNTAESGGEVRVHETAHVQALIFPAGAFAQAVALYAAADAENAPIKLVPGSGFSIVLSTSSVPALGQDPMQFTIEGQGTLVWNVDAAALAQALAGRESGAFQTIVNGFPSIQEAHAKIEPFWRSNFPSNPSDIKITIEPPSGS